MHSAESLRQRYLQGQSTPGEINAIARIYAEVRSMPFEQMITRRAYASETWLAIVGLSLYVGITEILPRRLRRG